MSVNPADKFAWMQRLAGDIAEVRRWVRDLQQQRQTYIQYATVTAYTAGSNSCTVTFQSGDTMPSVRLLNGYTPTIAPPDEVAVLIGPYQSIVVGKLRP